MISQNLGDILQVIAVLAPARKTASENGASIDMQQYVGDVKVILSTSAGGGTTPTLDVKLQDSDDGTTFADITSAAFTQVTSTAGTASLTLNIDAAKRYIRAVTTISGTSPTFDMALIAVGVKQVLA